MADLSERRPISTRSGTQLGTARVETLNVPETFGPWLPAKLSDLDFDAGALRANDNLVLDCGDDCQPLCMVLATLAAPDASTPPYTYIFMASQAPGHTRRCTRKEECRNFLRERSAPPYQEGAA